jgi:serine/threonine-protein kinase PpkA
VYPEIPGFKIIKMLGEGAMASVYLALDESLDRKVALKVMSESLVHDPVFLDRFLAEAKDTAKFIHPGIVSIYAMGEHNDDHYLVLEYLESGTLKDLQREKLRQKQEAGDESEALFSAQESLTILGQLADALAYAHGKKVVHRDIKPANILFRSNGQAVLSDFGIAKSVTENRELTQTGFSVGTPAYMSPEQKIGADIDTRSDLYSVGVVFYELLTGHKPKHSSTGNFAELRRELSAAVPQLPSHVAHLQPLLDKLMATDPDDRFQTADDLLDAIEDYTEGREVVRHTAVRKSRGLVYAAVAVLLLAIGGAAAWKFMPEPPPEVVPVDAKTAEEIEGLLATANLFHEMQNLIDPPVSNAAEQYRRVLELQPGNPYALQGLDEVLDEIITEIKADLEGGQLNEARERIELALHYYPDNKKLLRLLEDAG